MRKSGTNKLQNQNEVVYYTLIMTEGNIEGISFRDFTIKETQSFVSFGSVDLPKAKAPGESFYICKQEYLAKDDMEKIPYIGLQMALARSFYEGKPLLIDITDRAPNVYATINNMAKKLGWEFHWISLTSQSDVLEQPGNKGPFTSGLIPEKGKIKILIFDGIDIANPKVFELLKSLGDALQDNKSILIDGQRVQLLKEATKLVSINMSRNISSPNEPPKPTVRRQTKDIIEELKTWNHYETLGVPRISEEDAIALLEATIPKRNIEMPKSERLTYSFGPEKIVIGLTEYNKVRTYNTSDSWFVEGVVEYTPGPIVIKFPKDRVFTEGRFIGQTPEQILREEYQRFDLLAKKNYPWFPKPVGIVKDPFGIAVTKCEGDKLSELMPRFQTPAKPLTLSDKHHILRELAKAFMVLIDEGIVNHDWKSNDVLFDRKTGQVSYVDLNGAETLSEEYFSGDIQGSLSVFYRNILTTLAEKPSTRLDKIALIMKPFMSLDDSNVKQKVREHLRNLTLEKVIRELG